MRLGAIFDDGQAAFRPRAVALLGLLIGVNLLAWGWALWTFRDFPVLLGTALLAWSLGLRHAVDADHIAAIDNVTRKMMQGGKRPLGVGLFFSLGHSTVVFLASVAIAATATAFKAQIAEYHAVGGVIGTGLSALFLLAIAAVNLVVLRRIATAFGDLRAGRPIAAASLDDLLTGGGYLTAILRPAFRLITRSWHMYPLGLLFGLGFDTATEVGVLGISAAGATKGLDIWAILTFPALFAAGMSLVDAMDGILMVGAYGWAFVKPVRKLYYNMTITAVSVLVAVVVGGIEVLGLIGDQFGLRGPLWATVGALNDNFGTIGFLIIGLFLSAWLISAAIYRLRGYDDLDIT